MLSPGVPTDLVCDRVSMLHDYLAALLDHAQARRAEALFDFLELNAVFQLLARLVHEHAAVACPPE